MSIYFYSILANYTRKNLIVSVISQFYLCFSKKKTVKKSAMNWKNFNDLVCSCVLQGNLIIIFRVETYKVFGYFIILTKTFQNYLDCTLKEQKGSFEIYDWNSWIACLTHLVIFVGSILWLMKRNLKKIVFVEEDVHLIFKMIYFLIMFIFSDQGLQCYKEFIERMKKWINFLKILDFKISFLLTIFFFSSVEIKCLQYFTLPNNCFFFSIFT